jgi:outer membrane protein assembly factor BamE
MISSYLSHRATWFVSGRAMSVALTLVLCGCGTANNVSNRLAGMVSPYKIDVVQGNFVSKEQAAALQPGMTRLQVRDLLGTPLLTSIFHADRWDYVFTFRRQGAEPQSRKVTVHFKNDLLERFEAGELPTEAEFVASLDARSKSGTVPVLEASEESLARFGAARVPPVAQGAPASGAQPASLPPLPDRYPPLESPAR